MLDRLSGKKIMVVLPEATDLDSLVIDKGINSHSRSLIVCSICLLAEFGSMMTREIGHLV